MNNNKPWIISLRLPAELKSSQRELFISLLLKLAKSFSFLGMEDWSVNLPAAVKVLGIEAEFYDLSNFRTKDAPLTLYFQKKKDASTFVKLISNSFEDIKASKPRRQAQKDWMKEWRKHYKAVRIKEGKECLYILPAWKKCTAEMKKKYYVKIHPGQAFGTGTHATTNLCMRLFLKLSEDLVKAEKILSIGDFGAGTGILALSAAKWAKKNKKKIKIIASEIDPVAREQCRKNIRINGLKFPVLKQLPEKKTYTVLFANVLAPVLLEHREYLVRSITAEAYLILSGLLKKEADMFWKKFKKDFPGLKLVEKRVSGDWAALLVIK